MKSRGGFTLIGLVVVVMVIGILVAIAAPKFLAITGDATDNAARNSLNVLRGAIETYGAQHASVYPGTDEASFKEALIPYLRGPFPKCPVGPGDPVGVVVVNAGTPLLGTGDAAPTKMWKYDCKSGEIIINYSGTTKSGVRYDSF